MPTFKFYNVQALPITAKGKMIGKKGYKKIFDALKKQVDKEIKLNTLEAISYSLVNDHAIAPLEVINNEDIAYGEILKFDTVHTVVSTLGDEEKFVSKGGDSSKKYKYRFVFDFKLHILAIEASKSLPSAQVLIKALDSFISPHQERLFKEHTLEIIELTDAHSLTELFNVASAFKRLDVEITFSNSEGWEDELELKVAAKQEEEMREKGIHSRHLIEKSSTKSVMKELSDFGKTCLNLACKYGNASVTYLDQIGQPKTYHMLNSPIKETIKDTYKDENKVIKDKSKLDFSLDVKLAMINASTRSLGSKPIYDNLRGNNNEEKDIPKNPDN